MMMNNIEPDEVTISEGRRRLRAAGLTDEQIGEWLARVRLWGGRIQLTTDGLRASYDRTERSE